MSLSLIHISENTAASTPANAVLPPMRAMNTEVPELRPWPTMKQHLSLIHI